VPWKNGGGVTHEVLRAPPGDPFRWRLSVADIASSGPFSDFSGYHRTLVLLRGAGVRLNFDGGDERVLCEVGDLVEFDGGRPTRGSLLNGPCSDLNLMTSASDPRPHVRVERLTAPRRLDRQPRLTLVFPITGSLSVLRDDGAADDLPEWDLAVFPPGEGGLVRPAAAGSLVFLATLEDNLI
jgi:environmental stress-induced protein Ves